MSVFEYARAGLHEAMRKALPISSLRQATGIDRTEVVTEVVMQDSWGRMETDIGW